ncbi:hypothetical protein M5K25_027922 [Dendrobium thyrsiflorum]|uniref:Uncharacterized protein n=1 Tax=Dendrobium thyrsiflorum TaxID=117978 RepID=A0ABD0TV38_DENTH
MEEETSEGRFEIQICVWMDLFACEYGLASSHCHGSVECYSWLLHLMLSMKRKEGRLDVLVGDFMCGSV